MWRERDSQVTHRALKYEIGLQDTGLRDVFEELHICMLLVLGFQHREDELEAELLYYLRYHRTSLGGVLQP